ncbi:hypothetical protein HMI48_10240 [Acidithiobacillus ferrooxidans]|uniref:hypothetical protein n=1 Tax=Acidithiobacillus ferrooxidans TaxID=920 RepID=UPI001C06E569|nr:hypothetical protein [Acidithiobacillus ferrooxidans]MBU2774242.1 hypothetical protein [Acidithiobacillus ferrooxidans]
MFGKDSGGKAKKPVPPLKKRLITGGAILAAVAVLIGGKVLMGHQGVSTEGGADQVHVLKPSALPVPRPVPAAPKGLMSPVAAPLPLGAPTGTTAVVPPSIATTTAPAASGTSAEAQEIAQLIGSASQGAATVQNVYMNGPNGFVGVVYQIAGGDRGIAWVNLPDHLVLIGTLLTASGQDLNGPYLFAKTARSAGVSGATAPVTAPTQSGATGSIMATAYNGGTGFVVGTTGPEATVYIDPDSEKGHTLYLALAPLIQGGKIRVRYVPIAEKGKDSLAVAEAILSAPNPATALDKNEHLFKKRANGANKGGLRGITPNLQMTQIVDGNTGMLAAAGYISDPVMVYCDKTGSYQVQQGHQATMDLNAVMENIGVCH